MTVTIVRVKLTLGMTVYLLAPLEPTIVTWPVVLTMKFIPDSGALTLASAVEM